MKKNTCEILFCVVMRNFKEITRRVTGHERYYYQVLPIDRFYRKDLVTENNSLLLPTWMVRKFNNIILKSESSCSNTLWAVAP